MSPPPLSLLPSSHLTTPYSFSWPWSPNPRHRPPTPDVTKNNNNNNVQLPGLHPVRFQENGSSVWLPPPPPIKRPRATYNAASLAYLGDCVYEDVLLKRLLKDDFLSKEERDILRWGRNVQSGHKRATRRAGSAVYCSASSLETLLGYLYLTCPNRLEQVMGKLGFGRNSDQEGCEK